MKCPNCGLIDRDCKVTDSRPFKLTIKRTRKCSFCNHRWKTYEISEEKFLYLSSRDKTGRRPWTDEECKNLVKFREQEMSYKEIAKRLGRTEGSVKTHVLKLMDSGEYFLFLEELEEKVGC